MTHLEELLDKVKKTDPKPGIDGNCLLYQLPYDQKHHQIFKNTLDNTIPCKGCGNCCRNMDISLKDYEIITIAKHLGMSKDDFLKKYNIKQQDTTKFVNRFLIQGYPKCPFLEGDICSIYDIRPIVCREYPLYEEKNKLFLINTGKCARGKDIKQAYIDYLQEEINNEPKGDVNPKAEDP